MEERRTFTLSDHTKRKVRLGSAVELRFRVNAVGLSDEDDDDEDEEEEKEEAKGGAVRHVCKGDTIIKEWYEEDSQGKQIPGTAAYYVSVVKSKVLAVAHSHIYTHTSLTYPSTSTPMS